MDNEVVSVDDAPQVDHDAVVAALEDFKASEDASITEVGSKVDDVGSALVEVGEKVDGLEEGIRALGATKDGEASGAVTIDATQWADVEGLKANVAGSNAFLIFLTIVNVCVLAAIFGHMLWGDFSEGWRHG